VSNTVARQYRLVVQIPESDLLRVTRLLRYLHPRVEPQSDEVRTGGFIAAEPDRDWSQLTVASFARDWNSEADAIYDDESP
jgi:hypothetical protein